MKSSNIISTFVSAAVFAASTVGAQSWKTIPAIEPKGQHFFYSNNGTEFFIRGVAYQQDVSSNGTIGTDEPTSYTDPLADSDGCKRDIPLMTQLRTNAIRVYAVDPTKNHDECMSMLADAGIYLILDLSEPNQSINRNSPTWDGALYQRYISVIDAFQKYNNLLGFFAGNEVSNSYNTTEASAFVKAAVRDSKAYIKNNNYRTGMGVGYATYDGPIRDQLAQFFNCGDPSEAIDFWGYNVYSWCGDSNYVKSGYQARTDFFRDYSVPIFFAEYGCNTVDGAKGRKFSEVQAIFGDQMTPVWSGGIVYMWFQETNDFGLVQTSGTVASPLADFTALSSQMAKISPSLTNSAAYNPTNSPTSCPTLFNSSSAGAPTASESAWLAKASPLPPSPNQALCACEVDTLSCVSTSNDMSSYGDDFGFICGKMPEACAGINTNATSGAYGAISQCNPQQQLSWVMNKYYQAQKGAAKASACDFNGRASVKAASKPSGTCASLVKGVNSQGMGNVPAPSGNSQQQGSAGGGSGSGSGSGSGGGSGASGSGSKGAAAMQAVPSLTIGSLQIGLYVAGAFITGAGMILL